MNHRICLTALAVALFAAPSGCNRSAEQERRFRDPWAERRAEVQRRLAEREAAENLAGPAPRLTWDKREIDFAELHSEGVGEQSLTISNTGDAPLELTQTAGSAGRIQVDPAEASVAPGEQIQLTLRRPASGGEGPFSETIELQTNDPRVPTLQLAASGVVLRRLTVMPPQIELPRIRSDEPAETIAFVVSDIWESFQLTDGETTLEGAAWTVEPAEPSELKLLGAKSGYLVTFTAPAGMQHGIYRHSLSFTATLPGGEPQRIETPVSCKVLRKVAVYGDGIDKDGVIRLGVLPVGKKHFRRFTVKIYDEDRNVGDVTISTKPEFLQARLAPRATAKGNVYSLEVTVPADAPEKVCRGATEGQVSVDFGRADLEPLTLGVEFTTHWFHEDDLL
ncbi:MAG: hypothetical protein CMJ58_04120 [Planctomycetaceae bacterium]|nr:hypothetical protein [Planctomycetaceae bacterium]